MKKKLTPQQQAVMNFINGTDSIQVEVPKGLGKSLPLRYCSCGKQLAANETDLCYDCLKVECLQLRTKFNI